MDMKQNRQALQFTGSAGEYFKIWIVNIMLSIVTLGIYSAWAKVRTKRYFYGNTLLMGTAFDYLADPLKILKGRIIAFVVLVVYSVVASVSPGLQAIMMLLFIPVVPWVVIRALSFNAYNSAYRNIRFDFKSPYSSALGVFIGLPILVALSLGLAYPYFVKARKAFVIDHSAYGTSPFELQATAGQFYMIYIKAMLMYLGIGVAASMLLYLVVDMDIPLEQMEETQMITASFTMMLLLVPCMLLIFSYLYTSIANLTINETILQQHHFESTLSVGRMCWIYFSNAVLIMLTFGLMIPWAKVRTVNYRLSCISVCIQGNPDEFIAAESKRAEAIGEEIGDMFDMDIGL